MNENDRKLEGFIKKVLDSQAVKKQNNPSQQELKNIALEMGMSENDWNNYLTSFQNHLTRGKSFLKYRNFHDAMEEFKQANALNPYSSEALFLLAQAHKQRWQQQRTPADLQAARHYAESCLQIDPTHTQAIALISELRRKTPRQSSGSKVILLIVAVIVVFFLAGIFLFITFRSTTDTQQEQAKPDKPAVSYSAGDQHSSAADQNAQIPIKFEGNPKQHGLNFQLQSSLIDNFSNSYSYKLRGYFELKGYEIDQLKVKIDYVAPDGTVKWSDIKDVLRQHNPPARSGDLIAFGFDNYVKERLGESPKEIRLKIHQIEKNAAPPSYEPSPKIQVEWAASRPPNYNVEIRERFSGFNSSFTDGFYHELHFEVKNTGNSTIKQMKINIQWLDKQGELVESKDLYVTTSSKPKILRGQTRIVGGTYSIKGITRQQLGGYKAMVVNIE